MIKGEHSQGFSLIETVLSISIFLVTVIVLLAIISPVLASLDEVKRSDEIASISESLNSFIQSNTSLASNGSNFDLIYEAVKSRGYATIYIYRSYASEKSSNVQLSVGFSPRESTAGIKMKRSAKIRKFKNVAGPIYRAILTCAPHMSKQYYKDRGRSANPRYYLSQSLDFFENNFLPITISLYSTDQEPAFIDRIQLNEIILQRPILSYNTVINR